MTTEELNKFLGTVKENYRFTTDLDLEIIGRVAAPLAHSQAETIMRTVRANETDPARFNIPAFTARARAAIEHANTKPSTPRRLVDFFRSELGAESVNANGEPLDGMSCVTKFCERSWKAIKDQPGSRWTNALRGSIRRQARDALIELHWDEADADEVAAGIVEMPYERPEKPPTIWAGLQL